MNQFALLTILITFGAAAAPVDELRFCLHAAPRTLDPLLASDSASETIRYLTAGTLLRLDRRTQKLTPELARAWKISNANSVIEFNLRPDVRFSDGSPFRAADVRYTMNRLLDPALHSPVADAFRADAGKIEINQTGDLSIRIRFPKPVARIAELFDDVPMLSRTSPTAVLGPYAIASNKAGSEITLARNSYYWKRGPAGEALPAIPRLRITIQPNREMELLAFERGDLDLIPELSPTLVDRAAALRTGAIVDLGTSLDSLVLWLNQAPSAPLPGYKKKWFQSDAFRKSISMALNREDVCRVAYRGKAQPAIGPASPANKFWRNSSLKPDAYDPARALATLKAAGFVLRSGSLFDAEGHLVEFSALTNAGNKVHERTLALFQQDLRKIGITLNIVTLDFPPLIERITKTLSYESCLLPLTNVGLDPNDQMNVWLSSAPNHQWNANQRSPATKWEAEMDGLMKTQASSVDPAVRKKAFDRVQAIIAERVPFIYIAHPQSIAAASARVRMVGAPLWPNILWDIEHATVVNSTKAMRQ